MTTLIAGSTETLTATWREYAGGPLVTVTGVTITITPASGGAAVLGPTAAGVTYPAIGINAYAWASPALTPAGAYVVMWSCTDPQGDTVTAVELIDVLGAADTYLTLGELKASQDISDAVDDAELQLAIDTASEVVDDLCSGSTGVRGLFLPSAVASTRVYPVPGGTTLDQVSGMSMLLVDPISSLNDLAVSTGDPYSAYWTALPATSYRVDPINALATGSPITRLASPLGWSGYSYVQVTARWGYPAVPSRVRQATLLLAARYFKRKGSPLGVAGFGDYGPVRVSRNDPDVIALLGSLMPAGIA